MGETELLSVRETADVLNTTEPHVRALVRRGTLGSTRVGRLIRVSARSIQRILAQADEARD
jgi:excisionase family DNA binding protein